MPPTPSTLQQLIHDVLDKDPPRAKSLCVTLLGDAIEPHGGSIWLSDLIELVTPLGINERLLRTSVFRLVAQDWLQSQRHGRRSLYQLSDKGVELTQQASSRIYDGSATPWDGSWTLVILPRFGNNSLDRRGDARRELLWAGFGAVAPGIFTLPRDQSAIAREILKRLGLSDHALILSAQELNGRHGLSLDQLVPLCWDLSSLAAQYQSFIDTFGPMLPEIDSATLPAQAFAVRALTLHAWRRIVLHDPALPSQLLPPDWPGHAARLLCGQLYWASFELAQSHLLSVIARDETHFQPLKPYVYERFKPTA